MLCRAGRGNSKPGEPKKSMLAMETTSQRVASEALVKWDATGRRGATATVHIPD